MYDQQDQCLKTVSFYRWIGSTLQVGQRWLSHLTNDPMLILQRRLCQPLELHIGYPKFGISGWPNVILSCGPTLADRWQVSRWPKCDPSEANSATCEPICTLGQPEFPMLAQKPGAISWNGLFLLFVFSYQIIKVLCRPVTNMYGTCVLIMDKGFPRDDMSITQINHESFGKFNMLRNNGFALRKGA